MTTTQHTNGPWSYKEQWGYYKIHSEDEGVSVVHGIDSKSEANANLIATAPELLSALKEMMAVFQDHEQYDEESAEVVSIARAAIAKAEGK